jgi:RNA polymerase sigma factor (sigma-70 family)
MNSRSGRPSVVSPVRVRIQKAHQEILNSQRFLEHRRIPVTQQFIAGCLAAEKKGMVIAHPAKEHFTNVLYDSVVKMVTLICNKYSISCQAEVDDLVQDCFLRITKRIGTYDCQKSMFSTWCWQVCSSTMNSRYRNHIRHASHFVDTENIENYGEPENAAILSQDIAATIREIAEKYPTKKHILFGMFGNPDSEEFCLPTKVKLSKVARDIGVKYSEAYTFYRKVVKEAFKERFTRR